ncbi:MAG: hypothetical protein AAFP86_05525 [Planctomycetota bacterium]
MLRSSLRPGFLHAGPVHAGFVHAGALLALASAATAQVVPLPSPEDDGTKRLHHLEEDGALWVRGDSYKAAAAPEGFTFVPFLGSDAERNWPLELRLRSATVGGEPLPLNGRAEVARRGERVTLDRGPVDVHYDLAPDAVEQLFTFDAAGLRGAIVLELDVETDLEPRPLAGGAFAFDGPEGGARYGAAVAFDEAGRAVDVASDLKDGRIVLRVPAAFVRAAVGRITVDPLLNTSVTDSRPASLFRPDVAYDSTTDWFLVVYEEFFSATDTDVFARAIDTDGNVLDSFYASMTMLEATRPSVATNGASGRALIAFLRENPTDPHAAIAGRVYAFGSQTLLPLAEYADGLRENGPPDVGGNGSTNPVPWFLVVWNRDDVGSPAIVGLSQTVSTAGGPVGPTFLTTLSSNEDIDEIVVSKSVGDTAVANFWTVAMKAVDRTTGDMAIRVREYPPSGGPGTPDTVLKAFAPGATIDDIDVSDAIAAQDGAGNPLPATCLVSYERLGPGSEDTMLVVSREGAEIVTVPLQTIEHADVAADQRHARLATTRDRFVVSYLEETGVGAQYRVVVSTLDLIEGALLAVAERRVQLGDTGVLFSGGAAMASRASGGLLGSTWLMASWSRFETGAGSSSWNVRSALYAASSQSAVAPQYCYGTPNSTGERAFLTMRATNDTTTVKQLLASGAPPSQFSLLGIGTLPTQVFPVPNSSGTLCLGGAVGRFNGSITQASADGVVSILVDPTSMPTPTGFESATPGMGRVFQLWFRDVDGSGTPTSNFTNAVAVVFR